MGSLRKTMSDRPLAQVTAERDAFRRALLGSASTMSDGNIARTKLMVAILTQNIESRTKELQSWADQ
jgi:hypothetical protein